MPMIKAAKALRLVARGEFPQLMDRLLESGVTLRERRHHLAGASLFSAHRNSGIFVESFSERYADGERIDFAQALSERDPLLFYPGFESGPPFREFVELQGAAEIRAIKEVADAALNNRFPVFSMGLLSYGDPPRWNYDPVCGTLFPDGFYAAASEARETSELKVVWEVSRLQFVFDLGQAYFLTGDEKYAQKYFELIHSWSDYHRDYSGVAYGSALEFAFRINSLVWGIYFFRRTSALRQEYAGDIYRLLYISANFIQHHLSRYYAPNTHLLGEAWGLYIIGLMFPEFASSETWLSTGKSVLTAELDRQFTSDGMHSERCLAYHCYALEFILSAVILSERKGTPLPEPFYNRLSQMTEVLSTLQRPDGTWSWIGDHDGGRLHFLSRVGAADFRPLLEAAGLLAGLRRGAECAGRYRDSFWLVGARYEAKDLGARACESRYLSSAGLQVSRSAKRMFSVLQCGAFGYKDSPHSHADMLHLDVSVGCDNYLVDPGMYVYRADTNLRNYFRSQYTHNGPAPEGIQLLHPDDPFAWLAQPDCRVRECYQGSRSDYTHAAWAFRSGPAGSVEASRRVVFVRDSCWVILDTVASSQPRQVRWSFLTRCDIDRARGHAVLKGAEGALAILYSLQDFGNVDVSVHAAQVSTDYLCRAPASELRFTTSESASACAEFLLIPSMGAVIPGHTSSVAGKGRRQIDFRLENRGFTLSIGSGEFEMDGLRSDAEVLLRTSTGSDSFGCVVLNASFLASRTGTIFKAPCRIRYADVLLLNDGASVEVSEEDLNSLETGKPDLVVPVRNGAAR